MLRVFKCCRDYHKSLYNIVLEKHHVLLYVYRKELNEHRQTVHLLGCGICGEMSNTRDEVKSCFFAYLVYVDSCQQTLKWTVQTSCLFTSL